MFLPVFFVIVVISALVILFISMNDRNKAGWVKFFAMGKESGFSLKEIELLHKLAIKSRLENPASLFYSQNQLDACIKSYVNNMRLSGADSDQESQDFLSKLYDYRKKIEMDKPKVKRGISASHQIHDGQTLRVLLKGTGVFKSQVVKTSHVSIAISRPTSDKLPEPFPWEGQKVSVYFWREEDAGYVFDTEVQAEGFSRGLATLKIAHSDTLFRTQKRKSIRLKMHKAAFLYLAAHEEDFHKIETEPGLKCYLKDLSDTGCAVTVGGKAKTGMRVKAQFVLSGNPICMSGTVRSLEYKEELNRSVLHIESDPLPLEIRNMILGEVFGMLPEDEEDLPFRLLGEEAENMSAELLRQYSSEEEPGETEGQASLGTAV